MSNKLPDPKSVFPVPGVDSVTYVKPTLSNPNIIVGDFTYFADKDFESHVLHQFDAYGDKLIIGKFCQIGAGVSFIMNGANHQMNAVTTYPFYIFEGWDQTAPPIKSMPNKGDTVVGNDVWIGQNATILPGVHIGDGAIIGMNSVVGGDIPAYCVAVGNPAKVIRKRFDDDMIALLQKAKWWDLPVKEINELIPALTFSDVKMIKYKLIAISKRKR